MNREPWALPSTWRWATAGEIAEVVGGGTPSTADPLNFEDGDVPWVTPADLSGYSGAYISRGKRNITTKGLASSGARLLPKGAVLLSSRAPIGYVAVASNPIATNQGFKSFVIKEAILPEYLRYYLLQAKDLLHSMASGTTFLELAGRRAKEIPVPIAPSQEQASIVEALDSYFSRLDEVEAGLERVQRNLKRYRASVLQAAVTGRLVPTEAELARAEGREYEPASELLKRILVERRKKWEESGRRGKYEEPAPPDTSNLPELPEGWCWATVDQLTTGNRSSAYGVLVPGPDVDAGVQLVRVGDIDNGTVHVSGLKRIARKVADRFARTYLQGGEVLVTLVGTIGRTAVAPSSLSGANVARAVAVIPVSGMVTPHWLEAWLRSPAQRQTLISRAHEVARKTLNLEDVRAAPVGLPPIQEQERIVEALRDLESTEQAIGRSIESSQQRCSGLRQSILKSAFMGSLVDADPTAEGVAVLRASSRAAKVAGSGEGRPVHQRGRSR